MREVLASEGERPDEAWGREIRSSLGRNEQQKVDR
jgi:hypothetical protein